MSITGNFNEARMTERTLETLDKKTKVFENGVAEHHPSLATHAPFFEKLQEVLEQYVQKKQRILQAGGYTDASEIMRDLDEIAIRTAVSEFQYRVNKEPARVKDPGEWDTFRQQIRDEIPD